MMELEKRPATSSRKERLQVGLETYHRSGKAITKINVRALSLAVVFWGGDGALYSGKSSDNKFHSYALFSEADLCF